MTEKEIAETKTLREILAERDQPENIHEWIREQNSQPAGIHEFIHQQKQAEQKGEKTNE
jgi:hypothetical protein